MAGQPEHHPVRHKNRRWFLGLEPIFESGRTGNRARGWEVEDELLAIAIFGDVTIDLSETKTAPAEISISAYAIFRDVDVIVAEGVEVELFGSVVWGDLSNKVPPGRGENHDRVVKIHGRSLLGSVEIRTAETRR